MTPAFVGVAIPTICGARLTMTEDELWTAMQTQAEFVGHGAYRSDVFTLLALILAYYKSRGTEPAEMLSPKLMQLIDYFMAKEAS